MSTKITCPVCGAEFAIAEHTHVVTNATVIGKDSNLGELHPELAHKPSKSEQRLKALADAGVDISSLYALRGANGEDFIFKCEDGALSVLKDDDPVFDAVWKAGVIPERRLFRRWVMSQMFHMIAPKRGYRTYNGKTVWTDCNYTDALHAKGYEYQWKMTLEEMRVISKLMVNDKENFDERWLWFNSNLVGAMCRGYIATLSRLICNNKKRASNGAYIVRINHNTMALSDAKDTLDLLSRKLDKVLSARNPKETYMGLKEFNKARIKLPFDTPQNNDWVDAYKGSGAYYTMKNLIMFHGCRVHADNGHVLSKDESLAFLRGYAENQSLRHGGYNLLGMLKQLIVDNNIDIDRMIAEWK